MEFPFELVMRRGRVRLIPGWRRWTSGVEISKETGNGWLDWRKAIQRMSVVCAGRNCVLHTSAVNPFELQAYTADAAVLRHNMLELMGCNGDLNPGKGNKSQ